MRKRVGYKTLKLHRPSRRGVARGFRFLGFQRPTAPTAELARITDANYAVVGKFSKTNVRLLTVNLLAFNLFFSRSIISRFESSAASFSQQQVLANQL